jgi:hypothetical protein
VGGTLGVTGVFGHPTTTVVVGSSTSVAAGVSAASCPGGTGSVPLTGGQGVYAVARTADSGYIELRNPRDLSSDVWVPTSALVTNDFASLPVAGCNTTVVEPIPVVVPVVPGAPSKPKDTKPPSVTGVVVATNENCHVVVTATASDNVRVTSVSVTLSGANSGSHEMTLVSGHWQYEMTQPPVFSSGPTTFTVVAHDAAGLTSSSKAASASIQCLI